ncbi:MAG TPA: helix-turn-helix domain-containing protein [Anaerolineae bacterium]|nr:helix-turn-helix domain-containing protein [Anaerolineae bacterium]HID85607.1 helix-turn-helix domain-containing protein [Anaerolineales bacterium]HIQ08614.1 helix-turn-helix domain-containing protein [Anaerolineaceae bacterium]
MAKEWLTLGEVAQLLGVHPSTVRNWADSGKMPVHRTQGGHRRFRRSEVELWLQSQRANGDAAQAEQVLQEALKYIRWQIAEGELSRQGWFQKLNGEAREAYRKSGQALMQGLLVYLIGNEQAGMAEARSLGYEYAMRARQFDLTVEEAVDAFTFFRNGVFEALLKAFEASTVHSSTVWSTLTRRVMRFTDEVLRSLVSIYMKLCLKESAG